ncbi:MAG: hypothetical protein DWQ06_09865 [Calditrichaeota bacterium]|nr:MAG: hypothetical protein DWQ06_09865 [Calditrichota bacterium]
MQSSLKILALTAVSSMFIFASCENNDSDSLETFNEASFTEESNIHFSASGFEKNISKELTSNSGEIYSSGVIEYKMYGKVEAEVDFGNGENDEIAMISKDGKSTELRLRHRDDRDSKFEKVIIEPIVTTDDCDYPVSGLINFYQNGVLEFSINFGDGTCDNLAEIIGSDGEYKIIDLDEWRRKHRKSNKYEKDKNDNFRRVVTKELVKIDGCDYIVSGTIEIYENRRTLVATIDYGDGTCDEWATKTFPNGTVETFSINDKNEKDGFEKVIVNPIIKDANCDYPVSGTIQFLKDGVVIATIDYGDGTCDELATKTFPDGTVETFSINDLKKK